jgi:hypothetical protein
MPAHNTGPKDLAAPVTILMIWLPLTISVNRYMAITMTTRHFNCIIAQQKEKFFRPKKRSIGGLAKYAEKGYKLENQRTRKSGCRASGSQETSQKESQAGFLIT